MTEVEDSYGKVKVTLKLMFNQSVCLGVELLYGLLARFFVSLPYGASSRTSVRNDVCHVEVFVSIYKLFTN